MLVVGLTGGIGSGKSRVAGYFADLGARVIDADQLARDVVERGTAGFDEVVSAFGDSVLRNGDLDRRVLADLVFADKAAMRKLEGIIHPRVQRAFQESVNSLKEGEILIYEIPLLVETGAAERFDFVITVESDIGIRRERLRKRGMLPSEIEARLQAQTSTEARTALANYVILNNSSEDFLLREVEHLWEEVLPKWQREKS
ncbi:MAG: dephospho-CoA kinase [Candidatus Nanopelagicaceae bacterium]|nr:dephospho-CoA kinase [Candidatus Nanopelagicaceae bacterium]